jgi:hypothetical protein
MRDEFLSLVASSLLKTIANYNSASVDGPQWKTITAARSALQAMI